MPAFVCDASVAIAGVADDEDAPECKGLLERAIMDGAFAPALWHHEVANILALKLRRRLISVEGRKRALESLRGISVTVDSVTFDSVEFDRTIALADEYRLTFYDAAYLELAIRLRAPLATLDGALRAAAQAEHVLLLPA